MYKQSILFATVLLCCHIALGQTKKPTGPKCPVPAISKSPAGLKNAPQNTADLGSVIASVKAAIQCYQDNRGDGPDALPELAEADFEFKMTTNSSIGGSINLFVFKFDVGRTGDNTNDLTVRYFAPKKKSTGGLPLRLAKPPVFLTDALVSDMQGIASVVRDSGAANVNQAFGVITPDKEKLVPEFLVHFLVSPIAQGVIHGGKVETARPNISLGDLRDLEIPTPPLAEQRRVVSELDALQAEVGKLKHLQSATSTELDALLPSILDKALRGEL